ncbi:MAG: hypothetical protein ACE366_15405 [Bradymonadia bacterium]
MTLHKRLQQPLVSGELPSEVLSALGRWLLHHTHLELAGERLELVEIELYGYGPGHADPFAHRHPSQSTAGRWYLHRTGSGFRSGSFKGLDLTFGPSDTWGGVLIRALRLPSGMLVSGPSLCVDLILDRLGVAHPRDLHDMIWPHPVDAAAQPLRLAIHEPTTCPIWWTARVGLTLKRAADHPTMPHWLLKPYRALTAPREIKKGRVYLVAALLQAGQDAASISALTGSSKSSIRKAEALLTAGVALGGEVKAFEKFIGQGLSAVDLYQMHGLWKALSVRRSQ